MRSFLTLVSKSNLPSMKIVVLLAVCCLLSVVSYGQTQEFIAKQAFESIHSDSINLLLTLALTKEERSWLINTGPLSSKRKKEEQDYVAVDSMQLARSLKGCFKRLCGWEDVKLVNNATRHFSWDSVHFSGFDMLESRQGATTSCNILVKMKDGDGEFFFIIPAVQVEEKWRVYDCMYECYSAQWAKMKNAQKN